MASITYWSQLLPSPRSPSVAASLAARVRDPAWFLARQWQLGEFQGADAGSAAFVQIASHTAKLTSAQIGAATNALADAALLEPIVEAEPLTPDASTRVEMGQSFEALLSKAGVAAAVRDQFRAAYPIAPADASADAAAAAFLRVCAGRAVDGAALYAAAKPAANHLPPKPALAASTRTVVAKALSAFIAWVEATWGAVGTAEPPAWDATRLEYGCIVNATSPGGAAVSLSGQPDAQANVDWYAFDQESATPDTSQPATSTVIPGNVRFRGMPNARWWDFEGSKTDFGAVIPDARDLSKLLFMDFLLLHGDDWLLAPLDVATGSLAWIDVLTVTDVFGVATVIPRADAATAGARWTMYSTLDAPSGGLAQYLVVPSSAAAAALSSAPVEEVHLLRDETADLAWAIEHIVEGPTAFALQEPLPTPAAMAPGAPAPLEYQLATPLPASWFPLLPKQTNGVVSLVVGTVEGAGPPRGRIVHGLTGLQLPDAEIPRSGVQVRRLVCRARSHDGQMHLWVARRTRFGAGAASSSLRYDLAQPTP